MSLLPFEVPTKTSSIIKVLGVGGGGSNAVNHMFKEGIKGVDFIITNTDAQALGKSPVPVKIQLGATLTEGLGAGNNPERGREAAIESIEEIKAELGDNTKMVFITAGMGGGTGTGAAPVIAKATKELGILTVGIVTLPFSYEGKKRLNQAAEGIQEMSKYVDSLLIVNNEKLREIYGDFEVSKAFGKADDVLATAAKGIAEIITIEGHVNVDFADVKTVMTDSGIALMGSGKAQGENRAELAAEEALNSKLLDNNDINGAKNILINITSGKKEATMDELGLINEYVQDAAGNHAELIWGSSVDGTLDDHIMVTVIATGFGTDSIPEVYTTVKKEEKVKLDNDNFTQNPPAGNTVNSAPEKTIREEDIETVNVGEEITFDISDFDLNPDNDDFILVKGDKPIQNTAKKQKVEMKAKVAVEEDGFRIERVSETKSQNKINQSAYKNTFNAGDYRDRIDEYENIPAYERSGDKLDLDFNDDNQTLSKYTFTEDINGIKISENNQYLHDKAD